MPLHIKLAAKIVLWTAFAAALLLGAVRIYGLVRDVIDAKGDIPKMWGWFSVLTPEAIVLLSVALGASAVATFDSWWPALRQLAGHPLPDDGAPARVVELASEIARLKQEAAPRIQLEGFSQEGVQDLTGRETVFYSYIGVHNSGNTVLERCLVKVERIQMYETEPPQEMQAALTTKARHEDGQIGGRFALGPDERKRVLLTVRDASDLRRPGAHRIGLENVEFALHRGSACVVDLIAIADVGKADRARVRLSVDEEWWNLAA